MSTLLPNEAPPSTLSNSLRHFKTIVMELFYGALITGNHTIRSMPGFTWLGIRTRLLGACLSCNIYTFHCINSSSSDLKAPDYAICHVESPWHWTTHHFPPSKNSNNRWHTDTLTQGSPSEQRLPLKHRYTAVWWCDSGHHVSQSKIALPIFPVDLSKTKTF